MSELRECPRCKGSVSLQRFNVHPSLKARIICSCGIEMRASKRDSVEDLIERWNTRAERTCHPVEQLPPSEIISTPVRLSCGHFVEGIIDGEASMLPNFCEVCGARVTR